MAGPGGEIASHAAGEGHLRASHADREHVVGVLTAAFVQGMLTKLEFDLRIGQVLASRTYAELAAVTADIPPGLAPAQPQSVPERVSADKRALQAWACVTATFTAVAAAVAATTAGNLGKHELIVVIFVPVVAALVGVLLAFHAWLDRRAGKRSSLRLPPGAAGVASRPAVSGRAARQFPQVDRDPRHTAEAEAGHGPGQQSSSRRPSLRRRTLGRRYAIG